MNAGETIDAKNVCLLSRQRIVGSTNGSSAYVLSICRFLHAQGFTLHYLSPSASTFGRWPYIRLSPEMRVFRSIRIRGGLRLGNIILNLDPRAPLRGALALIDRKLRKIGLPFQLSSPSAYAIAKPLTELEARFVERHGHDIADRILADYAFLTDAIGCLRRPDAPSAVIMHDLFSSRAELFAAVQQDDSVATIDQASEMKLLAQADLVLAIQSTEAMTVRNFLPADRVVVAPMAAEAVPEPLPGEDDQILFVGSNTAPNVDAVGWFIEEIWPRLRAIRPRAKLSIVGSVCAALDKTPDGIALLGQVNALDAAYRNHAVVISPLRLGSGLKIKLIEAMSFGKAIVCTTITAQGVESEVENCLVIADDADAFAVAVADLCADKIERRRLGDKAITAIRRHFSPQACYGALVEHFTRKSQGH